MLLATVVGCGHLGMVVPERWSVTSLSMTGLHDDVFMPPQRTEIEAGQLVIHADFPLARRHRIVRELEQLRVDVSDDDGNQRILDIPIVVIPQGVHFRQLGDQTRVR